MSDGNNGWAPVNDSRPILRVTRVLLHCPPLRMKFTTFPRAYILLNPSHFYSEDGCTMFPETLVSSVKATWCHNPGDHNTNELTFRENPKSYTDKLSLMLFGDCNVS
jgi:hypothetical protein